MVRNLIALALLLLCARAEAQTLPWQREERTTAGWTFTPGTSLGGAWDSGIQPGGNAVVETLFKKYVGIANPFAELDYNGRHSHVNMGYSGSFEKYWSQDMRWEQRAKLNARRVLSPHVDVSGNASYSAVPTTDRLELVGGVVPFVNVNSRWFEGGGGVSWRAGPRTRVFGNYRFEQVTMDKVPFAAFTTFTTLRDGYSHAPLLGFTRDFTSRLSVGATGEYRRDHVGNDGDIFDIKTLTGEFTYRWSTAMSISGGGGVSQLVTVGTYLQTTSPTFHGGFSRQLRTMTLSSRYDRGFQQLFGFGTLAATHSLSGGAFVPMADRLYYLDLMAAYSRTDPIRDLGIGVNLNTLWTTAAIGRQLAPRLRGEAYISIAHQGSISSDSSNRTRLGIQIVTSKPLRIQ